MAFAAALMAASAVVFGALTEDVVNHDGWTRSDRSHLHFFISHRSGALITASRVVSNLGSTVGLLVLAVVITAALRRRRTHWALTAAPTASLLLGVTINSIIKQRVGRLRPPVSLRLVTEHARAFPSGHATNSTAFFAAAVAVVALVVLRRLLARAVVIAAGTAAAVAVGLSRLVLGVHWPTDVVAGWSLGLLIATAVVLAATLVARSGVGRGTVQLEQPGREGDDDERGHDHGGEAETGRVGEVE